MDNKILELSNRELKDIYGCLGGITTEEIYQTTQFELADKEEYKELIESLKARTERQMILINKIAKFIDWEKE